MDKIIKVKEAKLEFHFMGVLDAIKFDEERIPLMTNCLKAADILVEWDDQVWLIEVKKPTSRNLKNIKRKMGRQGKESFLYLYLNGQLDKRSLKYFVIIDIPDLNENELSTLTTHLCSSICLTKKWTLKNKYFDGALLFNESTWNRKFQQLCPITRVA